MLYPYFLFGKSFHCETTHYCLNPLIFKLIRTYINHPVQKKSHSAILFRPYKVQQRYYSYYFDLFNLPYFKSILFASTL